MAVRRYDVESVEIFLLQDHSLDQCLHFLYPIKGGDVKAVSKKMGKHDAKPEVSSEKICIRSCSAPITSEGAPDGSGGMK